MNSDPLLRDAKDRKYEATPAPVEINGHTYVDKRGSEKPHNSKKQQNSQERLALQDPEGSECLQLLCSGEGTGDYSIQDSIDHSGLGWFQFKLTVVLGLTWMADSMEIMLLSILGPVLSCEWYLPAWQQALLTALVMLGMTLGSSYWGTITDKFGRRTALALAAAMIGYFGFLSAFSPMYTWMAILRFLVGCCLACLAQTAVLYSEYMPTKNRPAGLLFLSIFWAVGAAMEVILAWLVMPTLGWRYLMAFSALPVLFFPMLSPWLPESARFYLASGQAKDADRMLQMVAKDNKKPHLPGKLESVDTELVARGHIQDMFTPSYRVTSFLLCVIWFLNAFLYYGVALLLPTLLNKPDGCHGSDIQEEDRDSCSAKCKAFTNEDYLDLVATAFADLPGLAVAWVMLQFMGRKSSIALASLLSAICLFVSNICMERLYLTGALFVARAMIAGGYQVLFIYTTECYPTNIRAIGMGVTSGASKLGGLVTPFFAQVLADHSAFATFTVYGTAALITTVLATVLPFDTRGRAMTDVAH